MKITRTSGRGIRADVEELRGAIGALKEAISKSRLLALDPKIDNILHGLLLDFKDAKTWSNKKPNRWTGPVPERWE